MNIEDKALLILAAKTDGRVLSEADIEKGLWNPLENSLEAFNLMANLKLNVEHQGRGMFVNDYYFDYDGSDIFAAVRRAIVRYVAEIGVIYET